MAKKLTVYAVENAKAGEKRREVPDALVPGLYLIIQPAPSTSRSWAIRYRHLGQPRNFTLGSSALDLKTARKLARDALALVAEGKDPAAVKAEREDAERERLAAAAKAAEAAAKAKTTTFAAVAERFIEEYAKPNQKSWKETARVLRRDIVSELGHLPIGEVAKADVKRVINGIKKDHRVLSINAHSHLTKLFNWCLDEDIIAVSPCQTLKPPAVKVSRDRALCDKELALVWKTAGDLGYPFGPVIQLLILTGARREEIAGMRWRELDLDGGTWTLPKERSKNKNEHTLQLPPQALAILRGLPRRFPGSDLIFTTNGRTSVSGYGRIMLRLNAAILAELQREAREARRDPAEVQPLERWTLHDLRRSAATGWARLGVPVATTEKLLNHVSGTFRGLVSIYQRYDYGSEKQAALKLWADHIEALVTPPPAPVQEPGDNVVAFPAQA